MKKLAFIAIVMTMLGACALPPTAPTRLKTAFSGADHERFRQNGTATISGQGFLRQQGGGVVTCAGSPVLLLPATPFFKEFISEVTAGRNVSMAGTVDAPYSSIIKKSQCDAQGNFSFSNIPAARWLVVTNVVWTAGRNKQGGALLKEIFIEDTKNFQVLLSDSEFLGQ